MKGQICIGPECDREPLRNFNVCKAHRAQQRRGYEELYPLGKQRPRNLIKPQCSFEWCERPCTGRKNLCHGHQQQLNAGKPLTALKGSAEARQRKSTGDMTKKEFDAWWSKFTAGLGR